MISCKSSFIVLPQNPPQQPSLRPQNSPSDRYLHPPQVLATAPPAIRIDAPAEMTQTSKTEKAQPWKKWLAEEVKASNDGKADDKTERPWTSWKPDPQDPSEQPWLYWRNAKTNAHDSDRSFSGTDDDDDDDRGPEMVGIGSRFHLMGVRAVTQ